MIQMVAREISGILLVNPEGGKIVVRAAGVSPLIEAVTFTRPTAARAVGERF